MNMQTQHRGPSLRRSGDRACVNALSQNNFIQPFGASAREPHAQATFEIRNAGEQTARGIEIELMGLGTNDAFQAYYLNRPGAPQVTKTPRSVQLRFESLGRIPTHALSQTAARAPAARKASQPFVWELALFCAGGSDRFCLELSTLEIVVSYRWLVAREEHADLLRADEVPAYVYDAHAGYAYRLVGESYKEKINWNPSTGAASRPFIA
jgi:hypothetical protein